MKKVTLIATTSALIFSIAASQPSFAAKEMNDANRARNALSSFTGAIIGGFAGGPIGAMVGLVAGSRIHETHHDKSEKITESKIQIEQLSTKLDKQHEALAKLESRQLNALTLQLLFATGQDEINQDDQNRLATLAEFLRSNPEINIQLKGYADPRGTEEYNNILSHERAKNVALILEEMGISSDRFNIVAYGESLSTANSHTPYEYSFDRKVSIELYREPEQSLSAVE